MSTVRAPITHHANRPKASKARPQDSDAREGQWTQPELRQMNQKFCCAMRKGLKLPPPPPSPVEHLERLLKSYRRREQWRARHAA